MGSPRRFLAALIILAGAAAAISGDHRLPAPGAPPGPPRSPGHRPDDQPRLLRGAVPAGWVRAGQAVHTEPSQAGRLAAIAATHRVVAVVVATGADDEPAFSPVLTNCVSGWALQTTPGCGEAIGPHWHRRGGAALPKVVQALRDVRAAMRTAGYRTEDYQLVVQTDAAPVGPDVADGNLHPAVTTRSGP